MKKIILFRGGVETLEYFSKQIGDTLQNAGHEIFIFDMQDMFGSFHDLLLFCKKGNFLPYYIYSFKFVPPECGSGGLFLS